MKKFSPVVNEPPEPAPIVKYRPVINVSPSIAGGECVVYFAALNELVDDEPAIARHLPGGKLPLDATAQACGLRSQRKLEALPAAAPGLQANYPVHPGGSTFEQVVGSAGRRAGRRGGSAAAGGGEGNVTKAWRASVAKLETITPSLETVNSCWPITSERSICGLAPLTASWAIRPTSVMPERSTRKPIAPTNPPVGSTVDAGPPLEPVAGSGCGVGGTETGVVE